MQAGMIAVKALRIGIGMNPNGQIAQITHSATPSKKMFVMPGKFAQIHMSNIANGTETIAEVPLGPFGWEVV